ncbi:MAG TPA: S41 family peptidase [Myxococcaceae bacterium]|nr:S41 family peptidase [Myxococcaceae bacterium]
MVPGFRLVTCFLVALATPQTSPSGTPSSQRAADGGRATTVSLVDEIATIVDQKFYSPAKLEQVRWRDAVARARREFAAAKDATGRTASLRKLLATLQTSHTGYYPRNDPVYWQWASLFEPVLQQNCAKERTPGFPIVREDIGVFGKEIDGEWFVLGVFGSGPAEKAGLKLGDRILTADNHPFSPVESFAGRAGKPVKLQVQRSLGAAPIPVLVTPQSTRPHEELRQATADSSQILQHKGRRIAYIHMWSWATIEFQKVLVDSIIKSNVEAADGFILDIRDGWGGAHMNYLAIFWRDVPLLERIARDGTRQPFDTQMRKPAVLLINGGTRSGKETVAYFAKKHHLARLVGERTAGAVVAGGPFCLSDGSMLLLAQSDGRVDGERLEGVGVAPDIEMPFDFRYAAGNDPQLARALDVLASEELPKR